VYVARVGEGGGEKRKVKLWQVKQKERDRLELLHVGEIVTLK